MPTAEEAFQQFINEVGWNTAHRYLYIERDSLRLPANSPRVIGNAIATYRADKAGTVPTHREPLQEGLIP